MFQTGEELMQKNPRQEGAKSVGGTGSMSVWSGSLELRGWRQGQKTIPVGRGRTGAWI